MKYLFTLIGLLSLPACANLWMDSTDQQNRVDFQYLSNRGVLTLPATTFPILWQPVVEQLEKQQHKNLSANESAAALRLLQSHEQTTRWQIEIAASSQKTTLPDIANNVNGKLAVNVGKSWGNEYLHGRLETDVVNGELAGSYIAIPAFNWLAYAAAKAQFWGPGHDLSLIFGHHGKPMPTIGIQRMAPTPFDFPILNWLGPWNAKAQFSKMESDRAVPDTLLWNARVNFRPAPYFEIGMSHVTQWGGEGYDSSLNGFFDMISGHEVCPSGVNDCHIDKKTRLGNQLASIDAKLSFNVNELSFSLYTQLVGEDAPVTGIVPADKVWMYGLSSYQPMLDGVLKVYAEYADTNRNCSPASPVQNCLYEHTVYQSGYRFRGIPLGSQYDNDSSSLVLGASLSQKRHAIEAKLKWLKLNEDDSDRSSSNDFAGHYLTATKQDLMVAEYQHQYISSKNASINVSLQGFLSGALSQSDRATVAISYQVNL